LPTVKDGGMFKYPNLQKVNARELQTHFYYVAKHNKTHSLEWAEDQFLYFPSYLEDRKE
jgi:hypothetical protein